MTKIIPKFHGEVESGKLRFDDPNSVAGYLKTISGRVDVVIKKYRKQRSTNQNSWYWACVTVLSEWMGEDKYDVHYALKARFLGFDTDNPLILRSTADLSTEEFTEFMKDIFKLAMDNNVVLPHPDQFELLMPPPDYIR